LRITIVALAVALLAPASAAAQTYPEPREPGKVAPKPPRPYETHTVCKKGRCDFGSIQKAVNAADAGDTIRVKRGVYREGVRINGRKKRYLKVIGNPSRPGRVVLEGGGSKQNGIAVNAADEVTVSGFKARNYRANGFFFTNLNGYTMNHLIAEKTGVYGLYAFNTIGGRILNSEAYYVNDGAFYIGQTPPQDRPKQTLVRNVEGWGSPIGFSATNMRYVTITKSRFYNNAIGIVPNALSSEKFPPPEKNVIVDNEIFWNNLNFHEGDPPFEPREEGTAALVPIGTGILLLGGRDHLIEDNRIYGNFLTGIAAIDGILLPAESPAVSLDRNVIRGNVFGLNGTDTNGRDVTYDGSGTGNCFTLAAGDTTYPADRSTVSACSTAAVSTTARDQMMSWVGTGALSGWVEHAHPPKPGYEPLENFKP
jgi:hypothetical protein